MVENAENKIGVKIDENVVDKLIAKIGKKRWLKSDEEIGKKWYGGRPRPFFFSFADFNLIILQKLKAGNCQIW